MKERRSRGGTGYLAVVLFALVSISAAQIPLPSSPSLHAGANTAIPLSTRVSLSSTTSHGVPLPPPTQGFPAQGRVGVPLTPARGTPFPSSSFNPTVTSFGVPLKTSTGGGGGGFTTLGGSRTIVPTVGRGIQETKPQGNFVRKGGASNFRINELPSSIELDKNLSPVPPYFVFSDDDSAEGTLTIGGPKTGGLLPIANPTSDPKLLRLLSLPTVRLRLVAEAKADKALKITSILMAHRQVRLRSQATL